LFDGATVNNQLLATHKFKPSISPFFGVNFHLNDQLYLYGSIGHGFSLPSVEETLLPEGNINEELKPESGINYEIGSRFQPNTGNVFIDGTIYWMDIKNLLITKRISENIFFGDNAGKTRHTGIEITGGTRINPKRYFNLPEFHYSGSITLSNNKFIEFEDNGKEFAGNHIPGIPTFIMSNNLHFIFWKNSYLHFQYRYSGKQFMDDSNFEIYKGYHYTAIKLGKSFKINEKGKMDVYLGINNLMNTNYASMILINAPSFDGSSPRYYYPGQPRTVFGGIRIHFKEK
jgi:iron complex outermembrane receptor protein